MNARIWLGGIALALAFGPFGVFAQVPVQPGQIASRSDVSTTESNQPIQISPTGELPASPFRTSRIARVDDNHRSVTMWKISIAAMLGASAFDAASSMGKVESNPLLRSSDGTFGSKGIAIKAGLAGASLVPQLLLRNRKDLRKVFTFANFVDAGLFAGIGAHNMGIKPVQH
jgi:hypothetical protein